MREPYSGMKKLGTMAPASLTLARLSRSICERPISVAADPLPSASASCLVAVTEISFKLTMESPYWLASNVPVGAAWECVATAMTAEDNNRLGTFKT